MGSCKITWDDEWLRLNIPRFSNRSDMYQEYIKHTKQNVCYRSFQSHCYSLLGPITSKCISWNDTWIIDNFNNYTYISDLLKTYNALFNCNISKNTFSTHIRRLGLHSNSSWTESENEWIKSNYHILGCNGVGELNRLFGHNRTSRALVSQAHRLGCYVDETCIENNRVFTRRVPLGTIIDDGEGYLKIKTGKGSSGWERLHKVIYEKTYGKLPDGMRIMFLDNNRRNVDISNLVVVPYSYSATMNNTGLKSFNPTLTLAGIKWCELNDKLKSVGGV